MNIHLDPDVVRARVRHLATVVDDLNELSGNMREAGLDQRSSWSDLTTASRVGPKFSTAAYSLASGVDAMMRSTETVRQALIEAVESFETVDEELMDELEAIGDDIRNARGATSGGGGPRPMLLY